MNSIILLVSISILLLVVFKYMSIYLKVRNSNEPILLKAKKTHSQYYGFVRFERGKEYTFGRVDNYFIYSTETENYKFTKKNLEENFTYTDLYSKLVLNNKGIT
ncbi:hypothetical protein ACOTVS_10010 [Aliarcobacter butzleri]